MLRGQIVNKFILFLKAKVGEEKQQTNGFVGRGNPKSCSYKWAWTNL